MKRVLVTGGSGFVGANLTRRLLRDGHECHLILRPGHQAWRLNEIANQFRKRMQRTWKTLKLSRIASARCGPIGLFHLAAYGAYSNQTGIERMVATNLLGTIGLLHACAGVGVEAFVHTGSSSEYGYKDHAAREEETIHPNSDYAITKAAATHYCQFAAARQAVNAITVRLYSVYGPYEEPTRLIPAFVIHGLRHTLPPLADPHIARDFVYVDDAVEAILRVAAGGRGGAIYNVCSGVQSTLAGVADTARRVMNIAAEPQWKSMLARAWDTDIWVGSPEFMAQEVGWQARVDFESGLIQTVDWMLKNPSRREFYEERIFGLTGTNLE